MNYSKPSSFSDYDIIVPGGRAGQDVRCECPKCFHDHKKQEKTLSADTERGLFHCFRCGWSGRVGGGDRGNIIPLDPIRTAHLEIERKAKADRARKALKEVYTGSYDFNHPEAKPTREYLSNRLAGHVLPTAPNDLRHHRNLTYFDSELKRRTGAHPVMLGVVRGVTGDSITLHRTYITLDGKKADVASPKKLMTPPGPKTVTGGAIQLYKPTETLILAEGIETALALTVALDEPSWATISAHGLAKVEIPEGVQRVIIGADRDKSCTGQKNALALKKRLSFEGIRSRVMLPDTVGQDWLDVLIRE